MKAGIRMRPAGMYDPAWRDAKIENPIHRPRGTRLEKERADLNSSTNSLELFRRQGHAESDRPPPPPFLQIKDLRPCHTYVTDTVLPVYLQ